MNMVESLPQSLINELNSFHKEFENLDLVDVSSRDFKNKFDRLNAAFDRAVDTNNKNWYKAADCDNLSDKEIKEILAKIKVNERVSIGKEFERNIENDRLIKQTSDLIDKILNKIHNN